MILIAHRGNVSGPNPEMENNPLYIDRALEKGYDVEVDIRGSFYTKFYLGHDEQQYMVSPEWLFERAGKIKKIECIINNIEIDKKGTI